MTDLIGVAISTTGHEHRMPFLETALGYWREALPLGSILYVTVDGTDADEARVREVVGDGFGAVVRVGQRLDGTSRNGRLGVAVNKNTGLELLMDSPAEHLFLSDDDFGPLSNAALALHTDDKICPHSMVCWGPSRLRRPGHNAWAEWTWPRGVLLYATRAVIDTVGGMDERFGIGGHEHVEWSQRIHRAGFTPHPFATPIEYAVDGGRGAATFWWANDMPNGVERGEELDKRRKAATSIERLPGDWSQAENILAERRTSHGFVPYRAHENGRTSATLFPTVAEEPGKRA